MIADTRIDEFVRAGALKVMGQLYLDGEISETDWKSFLAQTIHDAQGYDHIYNKIADLICRCHFVDMLPEIRYMLDHDLMDEGYLGDYDSCPCGSGKKYKFCCMNKPKEPVDDIESPEERRRWLERYPAVGRERIPGRVYLDDYYDRESIEADKLLYLGLMQRPGLIWKRDEQKENQRTREYLYLAFQKAAEIAERENLTSLGEFDKKHSIHYRCAEWLGRLLELLKDAGDQERYDEVRNWIQTMREED